MTAIAASATSRVTPTRMGARARMAPAAGPKTLTESPLMSTTAAPAPMACASITPWIPPATRAPCAHLRRSWGWGWVVVGIARHRSTVERVPTAIHPPSANDHPQLTGALRATRKTLARRSTARSRILSRSVALASRAPYTMRASPHPLCRLFSFSLQAIVVILFGIAAAFLLIAGIANTIQPAPAL